MVPSSGCSSRGSRLFPSDAAGLCFFGYVSTLGLDSRIALRLLQPGGKVDLDSVQCDPELAKLLLLDNTSGIIRRRLTQAPDLHSFVAELQDIAERILRTLSSPSSSAGLLSSSGRRDRGLPPPAYYARLVDDIDSVGWAHLASVDDSLSTLQLRAPDSTGRQHTLTVALPSDYPQSSPICTVDLPRPLELRWAGRGLGEAAAAGGDGRSKRGGGRNKRGCSSSLVDVLRQFRAALEQYLALWEVLEDLDGKTWVLEPENPTRAMCSRRVALAPHCSLMLTVDPHAPRALPEVRFLGAEAVVRPFRQSFNTQLHRWDHGQLLRANLERVLGCTLPSPSTTRKEDFSADCGICYSYRRVREGGRGGGGGAEDHKTAQEEQQQQQQLVAGSIPDKVCDNAKCRRPYHPQCLFEWLQALPTSRTSFDTMFGQCPYCSDPINVRVPR